MKKNAISTANANSIELNGRLLIADFQSAIANLVTAETAKYAAEQSEQATMQTLETVSAQNNGVYVTPRDIPQVSQEALVKSSLDAHIKKVQAEQITSYTAVQISQLEAEDKQKYIGKKMQVIVLDKDIGAIQSYWHDNQTGQSSQGLVKANAIKGVLEDMSFDKNLLIIKPLLASRLLLSARKYFLVSVVNPQTLQPIIDIRLL
ncbi:MAG TPA: hypothetical protein VM124_00840 [Candidatus Limnocylindrales bacterium]|nr:hypothetical protein [Candidatus Limnocylindrales bacterium]